MAAKCSIAPDIVWNCVIQALASCEQVDVSTLIGLVKLAPVISGEAGKDTREMIALRILESLFDHGNEATVDSDSTKNPKISFDVSERCEDVLKKILHEQTPERMTKLESEKWDIHSFLTHKKSSLPKSLLTKLKEEILESRHPLLASLKEKSKLVTGNVSEDISLVINDDQAKDDSALSPRKAKKRFQENVLQEADQVGNSTGGTTENAGTEEREMIIENPLEGPSKNKLIDQHDAHANTQRQHDQQQQLHCKDDNMPQDQSVSVDSMEILEFVVKSNDPPKNIVQLNYERADDERTDIAAKKEAFLKSQCTPSQECLAMTEFSEIDLCMKCNEGGQLLVCSSEACPLQVHESCLGLSVTFDENGEFFCPFCAYSRSISKYLEAKQKALLARKNLQAFSSFEVKRRLNKSSMKQSELEKNEGRQMGAACETTVEAHGNENIASRANNINCMSSNGGHSALPDPLIPDVNDASVQKPTDLPQNPIPEPTTPKQKCKEKESQKSTESNCSRKLRKRKAQYTPPSPVPLLRRRILPWTKSEEETLKEGVERYAGANNKGIPWKEILDFGRDVFHKGRTTIDLKDKWRNICKGSPSAS